MSLLHGSPCAVGIAPLGYRRHTSAGIGAMVVGYDGSPEAGLALTAARELAMKTNAELMLVAVAESPAIGTGKGGIAGLREIKAKIEEIMRGQLTEAKSTIPEGIDVDATLVSGEPVEGLIEAADTAGTLLLVGSRGYGPLRRVLLGSVSTQLVRSAPCPLIVTPRGMHHTAERPSKVGVETASWPA